MGNVVSGWEIARLWSADGRKSGGPVLRQGDRESAPQSQNALGRYISTVGPGDSPGQTQTESGAGLRSALVAPIKAFENSGEVML